MSEFMTISEAAKLPESVEPTIYQPARDNQFGGAAKLGNRWGSERQAPLDWLKHGGEAQVAAASSTKGRTA